MKQQLRGALSAPGNNNGVILDHGLFVTWGRNRRTGKKTLVLSVVHRQGPAQDAAQWGWNGPGMPVECYKEFIATLQAAADELVDAYGGLEDVLPD